MGVEEMDDFKGSTPEKDEPCGGDSSNAFQDDESSVTEKLTSDSHTIKFIQSDYESKNGDAKIDMGKGYKPHVGLGKEELMKYANDPFWIRLRMFLFVLFWLLWVAMLVGAIVIVIVTPKCSPKPEPKWYQSKPIYHVFVKSFQDTDGDGQGDINGLAQKADYLRELGVGGLLLSPIYPSPATQTEDHVSDYKGIDPKFGTLEDFSQLIDALKAQDIKVILDFVPNHSSDQHPWFTESKNRKEPYTDYYVWANATYSDGGTRQPPNNWVSVSGGSAWQWSPERQQYYLHQFSEHQPDLNLHNPRVRQELLNVLKFWLDRGVHGFRVNAVRHLLEDERLQNEPESDDPSASTGQYDSLKHIYTRDQPQVWELLGEWRDLLANYTDRVLMAELIPGNTTSAVELPLSLGLVELKGTPGPQEVLKALQQGGPAPLALALGGPQVSRLASRLSPELTSGVMALAVLAHGTPLLYYGDEIGMVDLPSVSGLASRSPMQWDNSSGAGFTSGTPWLSVHPNYRTLNVEAQRSVPGQESQLGLLKALVAVRREQPAALAGQMELGVTSEVVVMVRRGGPGLGLALNLGDSTGPVDLRSAGPALPPTGHLLLHTGASSNHTLGAPLPLDSALLLPGQALVFSFIPE